jgi:hypothetical protein
MDSPPFIAEDMEKGHSKTGVGNASPTATIAGSTHEGQVTACHGLLGYFQRLLHSELTESRGIERVMPEERHAVCTAVRGDGICPAVVKRSKGAATLL